MYSMCGKDEKTSVEQPASLLAEGSYNGFSTDSPVCSVVTVCLGQEQRRLSQSA